MYFILDFNGGTMVKYPFHPGEIMSLKLDHDVYKKLINFKKVTHTKDETADLYGG